MRGDREFGPTHVRGIANQRESPCWVRSPSDVVGIVFTFPASISVAGCKSTHGDSDECRK